MRVFVAESICGGGMSATAADAIPMELLREGRMMWESIVIDLASWVEVVTPIDTRLNLPRRSKDVGLSVTYIELEGSGKPPWKEWATMASDCDAALIIAPEIESELVKAINVLRASGCRVLAPSQETLRIASDKWLTAKWLNRNDIPHLSTWHGDQATHPNRPEKRANVTVGDWITKPSDGCGGSRVRRSDCFKTALGELQSDEILQARTPGRLASVTVLGCQCGQIQNLLPAVWQTVNESDWSYQGGCGPTDREHQARAAGLARRVVASLPGDFSGFLGIDMILGRTMEDDIVLEINPRLTTSYFGLRQMTGENLTRRLFVPMHSPPVITAGIESVVWQT